MTFSQRERAKLAALLIEKGPDAPTLCEGWTTRDMAAHLYVRENRPDAAAGMMLPFAEGHLEKVTKKVKSRGYRQVVTEWATGPGKLNPVRLVDSVMNRAEHFVHHEDVRRGEAINGGEIPPARPLTTAEVDALYTTLKAMAPLMLRKSDVNVVLNVTGRENINIGKNERETVTVTGDAGELLLWVYGRDAVHVHVDGDADKVVRAGI